MNSPPPLVVVHGLEQATLACRAALRHGRPLLLASGGYVAWATFSALLQAARAAVPEAPVEAAFDPGGRGGAAAEALCGGAPLLLLPPDHPQAPALAALAAARGARLLPPGEALDLAAAPDPEAALDALLAASPLPAAAADR